MGPVRKLKPPRHKLLLKRQQLVMLEWSIPFSLAFET
jgi:hypothetical protein